MRKEPRKEHHAQKTSKLDQVGWAPQRQCSKTEVPEGPERHGPGAPLMGVVVGPDG